MADFSDSDILGPDSGADTAPATGAASSSGSSSGGDWPIPSDFHGLVVHMGQPGTRQRNTPAPTSGFGPQTSRSASSSEFSDKDVLAAQAPPEDTGILSNTGQESWLSGAQKGLGTAVVNAAGDIIGMPGSMRHLGDILWAKGESAITGEPAEQILSRHQQQIAQAAPLGGAGEVDRDTVTAPVFNQTGAYKPSTEIGKMAQTGAEMAMASAIPGGIAGRVPTIGRAIGDIGVGAGSQLTTDVTGSPIAGMVAGVGGGLAAGQAVRGAKAAGQYAHAGMPDWVPGSVSAREARAGQQLNKLATNPDKVINTPADTNTALGQSTLGEQTGDEGLLEKQRQFTNTQTDQTPAFRQRAVAQNTDLQGHLAAQAPGGDQMAPSQRFQENYDGIEQAGQEAEDRLRANAQQYAQGLGQAADETTRGDVIRNGVQAVRDEVADRRNALYDAVDPDGTLNVVTSGAKAAGEQIANEGGQFAAPLSGDAHRLTETVRNLPKVMRFSDLRDVEQDITGSMGAERRQNGETQSWRRMSQLKGAVVDARNKALDNQRAYEARNAAEGRFPGDETSSSRMAAWERENGFERSHARSAEVEAGQGLRGNRGVSGQEAGSGAGSPSGVVSPLRKEGQGAGRAAGTEAVPEGAGQENLKEPLTGADEESAPLPPRYEGPEPAPEAPPGKPPRNAQPPKDKYPELEPNFTPEANAAQNRANEFYGEEQRIYKGKGNPVKTALNTNGYSGAYIQNSDAIPSAAVQSGPKGYEPARRFLEASGNSKDVAAAIRDKVLDPLRQTLMPDGTVNPTRFAKWQQDYAPAIRAIEEVVPGFRKQMSNAADATNAVLEAGVKRAAFRQQFAKTAAAKLLKASTPEEAEKIIGDMITAKDGPTRLRQLLQQANGDRAIIDGVQENAIRWIAGKVSNISEMGTSKIKVMSNSAMTKLLKENGAALKELFADRPDIYNNLYAIRDKLNQNQRMVAATNVKGSPGTAKDLIKSGALEHGSSHEGAMVLFGNHLLEHGVTAHAAAAGGLAGVAMAAKKLILSGKNKTQDLLADAILHPEYGKELMSRYRGAQDNSVAASFARGFRRSVILGPALRSSSDQRAKDQAKRTLSR